MLFQCYSYFPTPSRRTHVRHSELSLSDFASLRSSERKFALFALCSVTPLKFLPAPTPARIIPADFMAGLVARFVFDMLALFAHVFFGAGERHLVACHDRRREPL